MFDSRIFLRHRRVPLRILSFYQQFEKNSTENSDIPFLCINIFEGRKFLKHRSVPQRIFFGTVRQKKSTKPWCPLLCMKIFETRVFWNTGVFPPLVFSALSDKQFSTEISDVPFLCIKIFDIRNFLKHWRVPHGIFLHSETKNFRQNRDAPFYAWKFSIPEVFETQKCSLRIVSVLWDKKLSRGK